MLKRLSRLSRLSRFSLVVVLSASALAPAGAQTVRRLSDKDVPVANELRVRLNIADTAKPAASVRRVSDDEYRTLIAAATQALQDVNDPKGLADQEICAAQWGTKDAAGANLRKETQNRRSNVDLLLNHAGVLVPLLEKYAESVK